MSVRVMSWVLDHSTVTNRGDLLVLLILADHAHDDGSAAYPSVETLASKARLSRRGTYDALARLKAADAIKPDGRGPRGTISYIITMTEGVHQLHPATDAVRSTAQKECGPPHKRGAAAARGGAVTSTKGVQIPAPEPSLEPPLEEKQQQRAHASELVEEVASILDGASSNGPVDRDKLTELIDKQPAKDHRQAALETVAWSERETLQSVVKAYHHVLTDRPIVAPPLPGPERPTEEATAKWDAARTALHAGLAEGLFDIWIEPVVLLGVVDEQLVLGVPAEIRSWVADRYGTALDDALGDTAWRIDAIEAVRPLTTTPLNLGFTPIKETT